MATRVLFVDQSVLIQKMAVEAFAQQKIEVIKVANGYLATWLVNQINPDLVVADVSLPDKSGYDLCQYIKGDARLSHIPVVLLYWPDETFDNAKANGARADAYLTKPFESETLIETAQRLLEDSGHRHPFFAPIASEEPLDISDVFEESNFQSYRRVTASESDFPIPLEDGPAPPANRVEPAADEQAMTETDKNLISRRRSGSGKKAALALAAMAALAFALTLAIWKSTGVHETEPDLSTPVSKPQSELQPQTDSAASEESSQPVSSTFVEDRRSNNPAAPVFKPKNNPTANRAEDRQANNAYAQDRTASKPFEQAPPASNQLDVVPEKTNRIEQSPPQTVSSAATAPALPKDVKAGGASQRLESVNGFKEIGSGIKGAVLWSGKKAGRGLKAIGRGLKKAFKHDSKID